MESTAQHIQREPEEEPKRKAEEPREETFDSTADLYAKNELEQRHQRMERVIAQAKSRS